MRIIRMSRSLLKDYTSLINRARADWPGNKDLTVKQAELILYGNPNHDENNHFLAYVENKLVAECSSIVYPDDATKAGPSALITLSVLPEYRRTGIGTKLIKKTRQYLQQHNVKEIQVEVSATCKGSREFYEKLGFTTSDRDRTLELAINLLQKTARSPATNRLRYPVTQIPKRKNRIPQRVEQSKR